MKDLNNKRVWITGASGGIGKEMAIQMANAGAKLILTARSVEKLETLKESLAGDEHLICPMDLSKTEDIPGTVDKVITKVETIDILVNNAGISQRSLVKDTHLEVDRKIMELDYFSKVTLTKSLLPHMIKNQGGLIISISSVAGKIGTPMRSAYCAAKHALIGFMDALRAEVHANNIKVMVVTPGSVQTDISKMLWKAMGRNTILPIR